MEFLQSKTCLNLARSFAGESQARNRYTLYAEQARKEKLEYLARIFEETAENEKAHAKEFLEMIIKLAGQPVQNIAFDAGYPYQQGNTTENLQFAANGEREEHETAYPAFAAEARQEGFADAAALWENIAAIEGLHHRVFAEARKQLTDRTLYKKEAPVVWRCLNCGYIAEAVEPWRVCPVCHKDTGWVRGFVEQQ